MTKVVDERIDNSPQRTKLSAHKRPGNHYSFSSSMNLYPILPTPIFTSFITAFIYTLKSQGDMMQPCLTPLSILNCSLSLHFTLTQAKLSTYILLIPPNSLPPTSYILNTYHKVSLLTLLYAFSKSIKSSYTTFFLLCFLTYLL